jgi:predicted nucleic acid-binding protein
MVIDTNIIIACLKAEPKVVTILSDWKREGRALFVSSITVAESLAISSLTDFEITKIKLFLQNFISIPFDNSLAEIAANLRRKYFLQIPDAGIAASAIIRNVPLITRDRQFQKISELTVIEI